jgi:hypothetical protein
VRQVERLDWPPPTPPSGLFRDKNESEEPGVHVVGFRQPDEAPATSVRPPTPGAQRSKSSNLFAASV